MIFSKDADAGTIVIICWSRCGFFLLLLLLHLLLLSTNLLFFNFFSFRFVFIVFACLTNILPPLDNERKAKQTLRMAPKQQSFIIIKSESARPASPPYRRRNVSLAAHAVLHHRKGSPRGESSHNSDGTFVGFLFSVTGGEFHNICTPCDVSACLSFIPSFFLSFSCLQVGDPLSALLSLRSILNG